MKMTRLAARCPDLAVDLVTTTEPGASEHVSMLRLSEIGGSPLNYAEVARRPVEKSTWLSRVSVADSEATAHILAQHALKEFLSTHPGVVAKMKVAA
jgi:hypothetical protein